MYLRRYAVLTTDRVIMTELQEIPKFEAFGLYVFLLDIFNLCPSLKIRDQF